MRIKPFEALRPRVDVVDQVASVPYDTVNTEEARALAGKVGHSFLHVVRPEIDLPDDTEIYSDAVYNKALENFSNLRENNILQREGSPCLYLYQQIMGEHKQKGIVACCHIDDYKNNLILKHEKTRQDKEDDRTRHVTTLNANTGPVFLTYRDQPTIDSLIAEVEEGEPLYDFTASDGISHTVWKIQNPDQLVSAFDVVPKVYIADGHHRAAAAVRAGEEMKKSNSAHAGLEEYNWFMTVLFPSNQLKVLPYNRCVKDLNGMDKDQFLTKVKGVFSVSEEANPKPDGSCNVSMYLDGKWYGLSWESDSQADAVALLDVSCLQNLLLSPILGIADPRLDSRISFIGGIRGVDELTKRVDSGCDSVAFSMYPVTVDQMMDVADAGLCMPPKSTWFEPKLRSGLLVHSL